MKQACNEISKLASDSLDRPLSLSERLKFKLHLSMCSHCRDYDHNMKFIRKITDMMRSTRYGQVRLSDKQRQKLHHELDKSVD
ncbi:zf-HC2 domain-containing protein [Mariprofundus ferrooxydans]|nr:zf-HC2 domain-containing protein [Mariprofundus ferrooxydans]